MKVDFLNALTSLEAFKEFSYLDEKDVSFLHTFEDYRGFAIRFYNGGSNDPWKAFKFGAVKDLSIEELCDFSKLPFSSDYRDFASKRINGELCRIIIVPFHVKQSHLAELVTVVTFDTKFPYEEWCIFSEHMAGLICSKYRFPLHLLYSEHDDPEKLLVFLHEIQSLLNTSRMIDALPPGNPEKQSREWFEDDSPVLISFLQKIVHEFNILGAFIVQQAAPNFYNQISLIATDDSTDYELDVADMLEEMMSKNPININPKTQKLVIKTGKQDFSPSKPIPLIFSCQAGGVTYGHFGVLVSERQTHRHINPNSKFIPMLANQLGLYFSHFYQLRKEALHGRMLQQINQTCNTINSSVDIGAILFKLVESLNYLFGQYSGAILLFSRETAELEVVNFLGDRIPDGVTIDPVSALGAPILEAIKEGSVFDNRNKKYNLPIRYVLPLATTPQTTSFSEFVPMHSLGGVLLFESESNARLTEEDLTKLIPILLNGISASLQVACNYEEKLGTIKDLEGLMARLNDSDGLLDEMILIIRRLLKVNRISFLETEDSGNFLVIKKGFGLPENIINTRIPIGEEISGYVALHQKSCRIDDIEKEGLFKKRSREAYFNKSLLSVPLISQRGNLKRRVLGVINVNNKTNGLTFTNQDQQLLEAVAHLVVTALENVKFMYEEHEKNLLERQLGDARDIQMSLMPKTFSDLPLSMDVFGKSNPAKHIGGDFFDVIALDDGRWLIVLGDVSGKGMPAAILMAITRMIIHSVVQDCIDPVTILERINTRLCKELDSYHFVTLQLVAIDPKTGECEMSSAGHGPLMVKLNSCCQLIETQSGAPVGIVGLPAIYHKEPFKMIKNDILIMFTDGLTEERSPDGEMFGNDRVMSIMNVKSNNSAKELSEALINAAVSWRKNAEAHDDLTVLALKFKGTQNE